MQIKWVETACELDAEATIFSQQPSRQNSDLLKGKAHTATN